MLYKAPEHLESRFLADFTVGLDELTIILEHRPERSQWDRPLRVMYDEVCAEVREEQPKRERQTAPRISRKEHEQVVQELKSAQAEVQHLKSQIAELTKENRRLIRESAKLEGRLVELEKQSGVTA